MKKKYNLDNLNTLVKNELLIMIVKRRIIEKIQEEYPDLYSLAYLHLMFIKNVEGISQVELSYLTDTNPSTLHRNVKFLLKENYIEKKVSKRANENELYLTAKGEVVVIKIVKLIEKFEKEMNLTDKRAKELNKVFVEMINKHKTQ